MRKPVCGLQRVRLASGALVLGRRSDRGHGAVRRGHFCHRLPPGKAGAATDADARWCELSEGGRCRRRRFEDRDATAHARAQRKARGNPWLRHVRAYMREHGVQRMSTAFRLAKPSYDARKAAEAPPVPMLLQVDRSSAPLAGLGPHADEALRRVRTQEGAGSGGATVLGTGALRKRGGGKRQPPRLRPHTLRRARDEVKAHRRLAAEGLAQRVLWASPDNACMVVAPGTRRTLADIVREQHGRLRPAQAERLREICGHPSVHLRREHAQFAAHVFVEASDGVLYLAHVLPPVVRKAALRHNTRVLEAVDRLLYRPVFSGPE